MNSSLEGERTAATRRRNNGRVELRNEVERVYDEMRDCRP